MQWERREEGSGGVQGERSGNVQGKRRKTMGALLRVIYEERKVVEKKRRGEGEERRRRKSKTVALCVALLACTQSEQSDAKKEKNDFKLD